MRDQVDQARWIAVLAVTAIALYLCWLMLRPFMGVLAWAGVLVVVFYPVHKGIAQRTGRRSLSALISCLLVVLVVVLPLTLVTAAVIHEFSKVADRAWPSRARDHTRPASNFSTTHAHD